jgi:trehalose 6-phosphate phosphatase
LHGAERLNEDGRRELQEAPPDAVAKLEELRELLRKDAFGGLFESKPNAAVMHWRGLPPQRARLIEEKTRALFEPAAELTGLSLLPFESGIELRIGRDKGEAIEAIVEQAEPGTPVTYLGDDLTDEAGFCAVNRMRNPHLSVLVKPARRETAAEVWLRPPEGLLWFLGRWMDAVRGTGAARGKVELVGRGASEDGATGPAGSSFARGDAV